jgi:hypothetical protein
VEHGSRSGASEHADFYLRSREVSTIAIYRFKQEGPSLRLFEFRVSSFELLSFESSAARVSLEGRLEEAELARSGIEEADMARASLEGRLVEADEARAELVVRAEEADEAKSELVARLEETSMVKVSLEARLEDEGTARTSLESKLEDASTLSFRDAAEAVAELRVGCFSRMT